MSWDHRRVIEHVRYDLNASLKDTRYLPATSELVTLVVGVIQDAMSNLRGAGIIEGPICVATRIDAQDRGHLVLTPLGLYAALALTLVTKGLPGDYMPQKHEISNRPLPDLDEYLLAALSGGPKIEEWWVDQEGGTWVSEPGGTIYTKPENGGLGDPLRWV